jgi:hypothetical protein
VSDFTPPGSAERSAAATDAERYRIEADRCMSDYDALEVDALIMAEALDKIETGRRNRTFDPWAQEVARDALRRVSERVTDALVDLSHDRETISGG